MIFFFKPKKIHLDCFTDRQDVYQFSPIVKSSKLLPQWWKDLPRSKFDFDSMDIQNTMKSCMGFIDFFKESVAIPLWCDLAIKVEPVSNGAVHWNFSDGTTQVSSHQPQEYGEYLDKSYQHLKIHTPWYFSTKQDVNWVWVANSWNRNLLHKINVLSAVANYKYQHATAIQVIIPRTSEKQEIMLEHNTPLVNLFPMSEHKVVIHNHLVDTKEYHKYSIASATIKFSKKYLYLKNKIQEEERKCPFHKLK